MCGAKQQFLDAASGEKGCEISTCNFHIQRVLEQGHGPGIYFFTKILHKIKDGIIKDKYYSLIHEGKVLSATTVIIVKKFYFLS